MDGMNRKIKIAKMSIMLAAFALLLISSFSNAQVVSPNGALSIINLNTTPTTLVAGENVILTFQLYNSYSQPLNYVNIQLEASNPLIKVSPAYNFLLNSIGSGEYGGIGYDFFSYELHIPSTLPSGVYTIDVVADYEAQTSPGPNSPSSPAQSIIPINLYIYGKPYLSMTIQPNGILKPGVPTNVNIDLTNTGTAPIYNITLSLNNSKYFEILGGQKFTLGILQAGQSVVLPTLIMPSMNITNNTYTIYAYANYTTEQGNSTNTILKSPISMIINKPNIIVSTVSGMPTNLYPGSNQTINLLIQNIGTGDAKNVSVSFSGTNSISLGSTSSFFIADIPAGGSVNEQLFVTANENDSLNEYYIPERISFLNANYQNEIHKNASLGISVSSGAVLSIISEYSNLSAGATYVPLTLKIKNTGNEPAQEVALTLQSIYPITPVDANQYIASLNPGETTNITFYVSVDTSGNPGKYPITLYAQWNQPNGSTKEEYYSTTNYYTVVNGSSTSSSGSGSSAGALLVLVIIVIAVAYYFYRKRNTGSKKAKHSESAKEKEK